MTMQARQSWPLFIPIAVLFGLIYGPVLFAPSGYAPATRDSDFYLYYFPMAEAAFEILRGGELPLWNPYIDSGLPFLAAIEIGVLYPPNWLHLILPAERAFCVLYVLHVLLAISGTWLYVRGRGGSVAAALFSAQAFAFAAPSILHHDMGMTSVVYSSAWCPILFAAIDRCLRAPTSGRACLLSAAMGCQFLAGFPLFTLLLMALVPAYTACFGIDWRRLPSGRNVKVVLCLAAAALLAFGLIAPQFLATWECANQSQRGELTYDQSTNCSFPPLNLLTFFVPEFFGNDRNCPYWGEVYLFDAHAFCGTTTALLALAAVFFRRNREVVFWSLVVVAVLGVALGKHSLLYDACYALVPAVRRFRGMSRLAIFAVFGLSVLAGIGLDSVLSGRSATRQRNLALALGLPCAVLLVWAGYLLLAGSNVPGAWHEILSLVRAPGAELYSQVPSNFVSRFPQTSFETMLNSAVTSSAVVIVAICLIAARDRTGSPSRVRAIGLIGLLAVELYLFGAKYVTIMETEPWRSLARRVHSAIDDDRGLYRVAAWGRYPPVPLNRLLYGRLHDIGGHENFVPQRYSLFLQFWLGIEPLRQTFLTIPNHRSVYDVLNVKYFVDSAESDRMREGNELVRARILRFHGREYSLYRNKTVMPRVSLVHAADRAADLQAAFQSLERVYFGGRFDALTVIEGDSPFDLQSVSEAERLEEYVTVVEHSPGRIIVEAVCRAPGVLLYSENYFPGWEAKVDGSVVPILPANVFMRAVPVTAGRHRVEMTYRPKPFRVGCWMAGGALSVLTIQCLCAGYLNCSDQVRRLSCKGMCWFLFVACGRIGDGVS